MVFLQQNLIMHKYLKFVLAAVFFVGSFFLFSNGLFWWGMLAIIFGLLSIILFFFNEYLILAFFRLRKQDMEGSTKWINKITNPNKQLSKIQMGYFYFMKGITTAETNLVETEKHMKQALTHGLPFGHDKAMAKLNIASGMMRKGNKKEAKRLLKEAREDDKKGMVTAQIDMMEDQLKKVQVSRNPRQQQMQRRGRYF